MKTKEELQKAIDLVGGQMSRWWSKLTRAVGTIGKLKARQKRLQRHLDAIVEDERALRKARRKPPPPDDPLSTM